MEEFLNFIKLLSYLLSPMLFFIYIFSDGIKKYFNKKIIKVFSKLYKVDSKHPTKNKNTHNAKEKKEVKSIPLHKKGNSHTPAKRIVKNNYNYQDNIKIKYNASEINGNWRAGWSLDIHTIKSVSLGNGKFDTTYTETGNALNKLKYHQDYQQIDRLSNEVIEFLRTRMVTPYLHVIIPTPPSKYRQVQPVTAIAKKVSQVLNIPIDTNYVIKNRNTSELKSIDNPEERRRLLVNAFNIIDLRYQNKKVLLFDDLFRSGSTLKEITKTLYNVGKVQNVYVVTLTKTRSKR